MTVKKVQRRDATKMIIDHSLVLYVSERTAASAREHGCSKKEKKNQHQSLFVINIITMVTNHKYITLGNYLDA